MWILKLKSVNSEVKSVDSEAKKCGFVKKNSNFFYCLLPKVWFKDHSLPLVFGWAQFYWRHGGTVVIESTFHL